MHRWTDKASATGSGIGLYEAVDDRPTATGRAELVDP